MTIMKRIISSISTTFIILSTILTFSSCLYCEHQWNDATCISPKTCHLCNKTEGTVIEHQWVDASCTTPKTCQFCNAIEGDATGHNFTEATCTKPKTCSNCGKGEGEALGHTSGDWKTSGKGVKRLYCSICDKVLNSKYGFVENIYTVTDIPSELMNGEFKSVIDLFSKGFSQSGLDISDAETFNDGETYIFYFENLEFLGDKCDDSHLRPRIIYDGDAIENNGTPSRIFFGFYNPLKSNGYKETVEIVEDIAEALDISDSGLIDNDYSSSSKWATGEYATFTFTNLRLELIVSNTDGTVEIEIVPIVE